jgi:hypothetical protein
LNSWMMVSGAKSFEAARRSVSCGAGSPGNGAPDKY